MPDTSHTFPSQRTSPRRAGRPRRRRARLAALVAGAALAAAGCSSPAHPGAAAATTSIPATTTTTEPPPQYAASPYSWDRASSPALQVGGGQSATLASVLAPQLSGPWLVFGSRLGPSGSPAATVWSSPDAVSWTAGALDSTSGPSQADAAARYRNTTVVVGSTGEGAGQQAAVWTSGGPGSAFTAQTVPASNGPSVMREVAAGALGMFAAGTVDGRFAMWTSTNGRQWSEIPGAEKVIGSTPGARVNALTAEGPYLYAAGSIQPGAVQQAALWVTGDGLNWHRVGSATSSFSGPEGMVIYSLAPLGTGLVAVGAVERGDGWQPASWISPDGQSWSLPSVDFPAVPHPTGAAAYLGPAGGTAARSVETIPTLAGINPLVATGGGPYGQDAWESVDGLHWTSLSLPAAAAGTGSWRAEAIAATTQVAVVVDSEPGQPYLLTDHAPLVNGISGSAQTPAVIAGTWTQPSADPTVFGPVRAEAVPVSLTHSATGDLQLTVDLVRRPQVIGPPAVTTMAFSSSDGSTWTALPHPATGAGTSSLPAPGALAARLPTGWVAVSTAVGTPADTWVSSTGSTWLPASPLAPQTQTTSTSSTSSPSETIGPSVTPSVMVNGICTARLASPGGTAAAGGSVSSPSETPATATNRYLVESVGDVISVTTAPSSTGEGASQPVVTRSAGAWWSPAGIHWRNASVGPAPPAGGSVSMSGCQAAGTALVAYGETTGGSGAPQPAIWRSSDGASWSRTSVAAFGSGPTAPLLSLATDGAYWIAAASPDPTADPLKSGVADARGPAAGAAVDAGVGPSPSVEDGREAVWLSVDGGSAWQLIDTATAPWLGNQRSSVDLVAFGAALPAGSTVHATSPTSPTGPTASNPTAAGSAPVPTPVVAGVTDGQLVVWIGTPTPQASGG